VPCSRVLLVSISLVTVCRDRRSVLRRHVSYIQQDSQSTPCDPLAGGDGTRPGHKRFSGSHWVHTGAAKQPLQLTREWAGEKLRSSAPLFSSHAIAPECTVLAGRLAESQACR
jgi:hypothetical protein